MAFESTQLKSPSPLRVTARADTEKFDMTPIEVAQKTGIGYDGVLSELDQFIISASARELQEFIHRTVARGDQQHYNRAINALNIRLAEDAAISADKLVQHTEKLTAQTDIHIQQSKTQTQQTAVLIKESRGLRFLTWGLLILTAALLYVDWHREHEIALSHPSTAPTNLPMPTNNPEPTKP